MPARRILLLAFLLTSAPGLAGAAPISVSWTGTVSYVAPELDSAFAIGDPASGSFQIDTAIADADPNPMFGTYPGAATAITFYFGSDVVSASSGTASITDSLGDGFGIGVQSLGGTIDGVSVDALSFFIQSGPGALTSDAIPLSLDFALFHGDATIYMDSVGSQPLLRATASSLSYVVPEPGTGMLLGLGMLLLVPQRQRR